VNAQTMNKRAMALRCGVAVLVMALAAIALLPAGHVGADESIVVVMEQVVEEIHGIEHELEHVEENLRMLFWSNLGIIAAMLCVAAAVWFKKN
jgi:hypothetical protein